MKLMQRLEDEKYKPTEERIFLELADDSISKMEILIGPRATDEQINRVIRHGNSKWNTRGKY